MMQSALKTMNKTIDLNWQEIDFIRGFMMEVVDNDEQYYTQTGKAIARRIIKKLDEE